MLPCLKHVDNGRDDRVFDNIMAADSVGLRYTGFEADKSLDHLELALPW